MQKFFHEDGVINHAGIAVVHTTKFKPTVSGEGTATVLTRAAATNYRDFFRFTVHTCFNNAVTSHTVNSWDDANIIVIASYADMVEANGKPSNINRSDTFWVPENGALEFPNAMILQGNRGNHGQLLQETGCGRYSYKTEDFTLEDLNTVSLGYLDLDWRDDREYGTPYSLKRISYENYLIQGLDRVTRNAFGSNYTPSGMVISEAIPFWESLQAQRDEAAKTGRRTSLYHALGEAGMTGSARRDFINEIVVLAKHHAVGQVLNNHGFEQMSVGQDDWSTSTGNFALSQQVPHDQHSYGPHHKLESFMFDMQLKLCRIAMDLQKNGLSSQNDAYFREIYGTARTNAADLLADLPPLDQDRLTPLLDKQFKLLWDNPVLESIAATLAEKRTLTNVL